MGKQLFNSKDYVPFLLGVFILGGLINIPLIYYSISKIAYFSSLPWALASCVVFVAVFRFDGSLSWLRLILFFFIFSLLANVYSRHAQVDNLAFTGALSFLILLGCGKFATLLSEVIRDSYK